ncbi:MAG: BMP family protein [bacterium]|nr:BMP family protein [bacterium]
MLTHRKPGFARLLAVLAVLALIATACGDDAEEPTTTEAAAPQTTAAEAPEEDMPEEDMPEEDMPEEDMPMEPLRIAVVAPSASNDLAFTQSIVDAVNVIVAENPGTEVAITDGTFIVEDAAAAIRGYAEEGYDLVIAHGSQYGGSLQEIAGDFPDTAFAWGTSADTLGQPNVSAYTAASDQGGFVMGVVAAALSQSSVIGVVGPIEVGDAKLYVDGFHNGAVATGPDVTVLINYIGSFSDVALASEAAQAHIAAGADVLTGSAQMVVGAVGVAQTAGALWFGTQANQTALAPDLVVASQVYKWEVVLRQIIADISAGSLGGKAYEINLANGGLVIEFNDGFNLPTEVRAGADIVISGIVSGAINTMEAMAAPPAPMEPLRIAVVAPSASNDLAFTQSIVDAVNVIVAEQPGTEVAITDGTFIVEDAAAAIRGYAEEGYDLVIAHGSQYGGSLQEIAGDFPDTAFAWGTSADTLGQPNVSAYTAASDQGGFVMGVVAAALSQSSVIGVVGPIEVGDAKLYVDGFHNGAVATGPDVTVLINYIGSFSDVALASEAAQAHIAAGADVLTGSAQMVVGAVGVAQTAGALWFGTQANQTALAPDLVVASQVYKWEVVLRQIIADISAGSLGGKAYEINLANGGLVLEPNPAFDIPPEMFAGINEVIQGIITGAIDTGAN